MRRAPPTLQQMPKTENRGKTPSLYIGKFLDKTATPQRKKGRNRSTRLFKNRLATHQLPTIAWKGKRKRQKISTRRATKRKV